MRARLQPRCWSHSAGLRADRHVITHGMTQNAGIDKIITKFNAWAKKDAVAEEAFEDEESAAFAKINVRELARRLLFKN